MISVSILKSPYITVDRFPLAHTNALRRWENSVMSVVKEYNTVQLNYIKCGTHIYQNLPIQVGHCHPLC